MALINTFFKKNERSIAQKSNFRAENEHPI